MWHQIRKWFVTQIKSKVRNRDYYSHFSVIFQIIGKHVIVFVRPILKKVGLTDLLDQGGKLTADMNLSSTEGLKAQIKIIVAIFEWSYKQKAHFSLLVSDWCWEKSESTDLLDHDVKPTLDMNLVLR